MKYLKYLIAGEMVISYNIAIIGHGSYRDSELYGGRGNREELQEMYDYVQTDQQFYRISSSLTYTNSSMIFNYKGVNNTFHSAYNYNLKKLNNLSRLTTNEDSWSMQYYERRPHLDNFLNVKYYTLANDDINIPFGFNKLKEFNHYSVYQNQNFTELGLVFDALVSEKLLLGDVNNNISSWPTTEHEREIIYNYGAILNDNDISEITAENDFSILETRDSSLLSSYQRIYKKTQTYYNKENDQEIELVDAPEDYPYIAGNKIIITTDTKIKEGSDYNVNIRFPLSISAQVTFYNSDDQILLTDSNSSSYNNKYDKSYYLNEPFSKVEIEFTETSNKKGKVYSPILDYQYYDDYLESVSAATINKLENIYYDSNFIKFTTNFIDQKFINLSIPYDSGWTLKVDNIERKIYKTTLGMIGFIADADEHNYSLNYFTPSLKSGLLVTAIGSVLCIGFIIYANYFRAIQKPNNKRSDWSISDSPYE